MSLEGWGQKTCDSIIHLPCEGWVLVHWQPDILPIAPHMVGQTDGHRRGTPPAALAQTFMGHHEVIETDQQPEPALGADPAPGQTAGAAAQRGQQAAQGAIPPFHTGPLDRRAELPQAQLLDKAARTTDDHAPADVDDLPGVVTHLDDLRIEQVCGGYKTWFGLAPWCQDTFSKVASNLSFT